MQTTSHDIIIVGGGIVGLTLACALAQQTSLSIAILEASSRIDTWSDAQYHHRVSAIALSSRRIFQGIQVWDEMKKKRVSPFTHIAVWDSAGSDLRFDSKEIAESVLGYIVENNVMQNTLLEKIKQFPQIQYLSSVELTDAQESINQIIISMANGQQLTSKLAIAADGAQSWLRSKVGIALEQKNYEQQAIVATVQTSLPHHNIAQQVFLSTGPLAFLPLAHPATSSIVWSLPIEEAKRLQELNELEFKIELAKAFSYRLGEVIGIDKRYTFPLQKQTAKNYVKSRIALVGDAAHTIHPLAGQGLNMGLLDAASLVDVLVDAIEKGRDFASLSTLRRYERWRKADNQSMMVGVDAIKSLFASNQPVVQSWRPVGLELVNQLSLIRKFFSRQAVGNRAGLPRLASF